MAGWVARGDIVAAIGGGVRPEELHARLMAGRIVLLAGPIDEAAANLAVAQCLYFDGQDATREIGLYLDSPGGAMAAGLAIYDALQFLRAPVATLAVGQAGGVAALLLAAGTPGRRFALPGARVVLAGVSAEPWEADLPLLVDELLRVGAEGLSILARHTGQDPARLGADSARGLNLSAEEARAYGIIDAIAGLDGSGTAGR